MGNYSFNIPELDAFGAALDTGLGDDAMRAKERIPKGKSFEEVMRENPYAAVDGTSKNVDLFKASNDAKAETNYHAELDLNQGKALTSSDSDRVGTALTTALTGILPLVAGYFAGGQAGAGIGGALGAQAAQRYADGVHRDELQHKKDLQDAAKATRKHEDDVDIMARRLFLQSVTPTADAKNASIMGVPLREYMDSYHRKGGSGDPALSKKREADTEWANIRAQSARQRLDAINNPGSEHYIVKADPAHPPDKQANSNTGPFQTRLAATDMLLSAYEDIKDVIEDSTLTGPSKQKALQERANLINLTKVLNNYGAAFSKNEEDLAREGIPAFARLQDVIEGNVNAYSFKDAIENAEKILDRNLMASSKSAGYQILGKIDPKIERAVASAKMAKSPDDIARIASSLPPQKRDQFFSKLQSLAEASDMAMEPETTSYPTGTLPKVQEAKQQGIDNPLTPAEQEELRMLRAKYPNG